MVELVLRNGSLLRTQIVDDCPDINKRRQGEGNSRMRLDKKIYGKSFKGEPRSVGIGTLDYQWGCCNVKVNPLVR